MGGCYRDLDLLVVGALGYGELVSKVMSTLIGIM